MAVLLQFESRSNTNYTVSRSQCETEEEIFCGSLLSSLYCLSCQDTSIKRKKFQDLKLDTTESCTIAEELTRHFVRFMFRTCEKCQQRVRVKETLLVIQQPTVLLIRCEVKGTINIEISQEIELTLQHSSDDVTVLKYQLVSMVVKSHGHYRAYLLAEDKFCQESLPDGSTYELFYELTNNAADGATIDKTTVKAKRIVRKMPLNNEALFLKITENTEKAEKKPKRKNDVLNVSICCNTRCT